MTAKIAEDPDFQAFQALVGAAVRKARTDKGLTQVQLASLVGGKRAAIHNLEVGRMVSLHLVWSVARALGVEVGDLCPRRPANGPPGPGVYSLCYPAAPGGWGRASRFVHVAEESGRLVWTDPLADLPGATVGDPEWTPYEVTRG